MTRAICGAKTVNRGACRRRAGQGTDHEGVGRCSIHGGNTESGIKAAGTTVGADMLMRTSPVMGVPIQMEPVDALLWCVSITAGEVAWLTQKVQELTDENWTEHPKSGSREKGTTGAVNMHGEEGYRDIKTTAYGARDISLAIRERQRAVDRLARFSKMALDAGVAERAVSLAERQGDIIAHVLQGLVKDLSLTPAQMDVLEVALPQRLLALEGSAVLA